jgi:LysM repeat protein
MSVAPELPFTDAPSRRAGQATVIPFPRPAEPRRAEVIHLPVRPLLDPDLLPEWLAGHDTPAPAQPGVGRAGVRSRGAGVRPAGVRLTRRGRLVLLGLAAFAVAGLLVLLAPRLTDPPAPAVAVPATAPATIVVQPGDTLWSIAHEIAPDQDTRRVMAALRRLNALPGTDLDVGQQLRIRP